MTNPDYDPDGRGFEKPEEGYTRIFEDHTGRFYKDYSPSQMQLMKILREEIQKEINIEIIGIEEAPCSIF